MKAGISQALQRSAFLGESLQKIEAPKQSQNQKELHGLFSKLWALSVIGYITAPIYYLGVPKRDPNFGNYPHGRVQPTTNKRVGKTHALYSFRRQDNKSTTSRTGGFSHFLHSPFQGSGRTTVQRCDSRQHCLQYIVLHWGQNQCFCAQRFPSQYDRQTLQVKRCMAFFSIGCPQSHSQPYIRFSTNHNATLLPTYPNQM